MGISVSNSEANTQIQMVRQYKKQKRLEMIGSEVQKATYDKYDAEVLKENLRYSKSANVSPNPYNTKNSIQKEQNGNKIYPEGQKKVQNNALRVPEYLNKLQENQLKSPKQPKKTHESKFAETQQITNQKATNPPEKAVMNSQRLTDSKHRNTLNKNWKKDNNSIKEVQPLKSPATPNKSWIDHNRIKEVKPLVSPVTPNNSWGKPLLKSSTPAEKPSQNEEFNIGMRKPSFGQYDWNIPGEQQQDTFRRKGLVPSMNLVLSNKFAQHPSHISEQAEKLAGKSRRQIIREVLSGRRNTAEDDFKFLPNCNFQQLQVSRICRNR